jgi:hypothetical protein
LAGDIHEIFGSGKESTVMNRERNKYQEAREQLVIALLEGHS